MESSSSDEENSELPFWNNWLSPCEGFLKQPDSSEGDEVTSEFDSDSSMSSSISSMETDSEYDNGIPLLNFSQINIKKRAKLIQEKNVNVKVEDRSDDKEMVQRCESMTTTFSKDMIFDRDKRVQLHDVTNFNDGDLVWGAVNLGVFVQIKLWVNEYDNMCASADGLICKLGSMESTFISITNAELLRKMLGISTAQWASLCEATQETQATLIFDAFQDFPFSSKTPLEKLWFFMCKRRHLLPDQWMLVKLCGAVKCMKNFNITPKVVVQEIRTSSEQSLT